MKNFDIKDSNKLLNIVYEPIPAMEWVFLSEELIGVLAHSDDELAMILKSATGLESLETKVDQSQLTTKIIKGLIKALSHYSDTEKTAIYNRIFKGFSLRTPEGAVVYITCDAINSLIKNPANFYVIVFNCLKCHYEDFFLEIKEKLSTLKNTEETNTNS